MIELYKDGNVMAIQTDAIDEREFIDDFAMLLADMISKGKFMLAEYEGGAELGDKYSNDWEFQFNQWLPQMVDICCKYRGYKNTVHGKKLLIAGDPNVNGMSLEGTTTNEIKINDVTGKEIEND